MRTRLRACASASALAIVAALVAIAPAPAAADPGTLPPGVTQLPRGAFSDLLVDDAHERVFISMFNPASITVTDLAGTVRTTITDVVEPLDLAAAPGESAIYAAEGDGSHRLARIDTATYAVSRVELPPTQCPSSLAVVSGKVWYGYTDCATYRQGSIGVWDPATGTLTETGIATDGTARLDAVTGRPDRLILTEPYATKMTTRALDVTTVRPTVVATAARACRDIASLAGGERLIGACIGQDSGFAVHSTADLSGKGTVGSAYPRVAAVSGDGRYLATVSDLDGRTLEVRPVRGETIGGVVHHVGYGADVMADPRSLAFTESGRLLAVTSSLAGTRMWIFYDWNRYTTTINAKAPRTVTPTGTVTISGTVTPAPAGGSVEVTRNGVPLPAAPIGAGGVFSFTDKPGVPNGVVDYTVGYQGDSEHAWSGWQTRMRVRPLDYDFNADGYPEAVVGTPNEDTGNATDTGQIHVFPGTPGGVTATGSRVIDQNTPGVPENNETGDHFGAVTASGDFDGDGYADLAVSAPDEDVQWSTDNGQVFVFYGSRDGLTTTRSPDLSWVSGIRGRTGAALAVGDFNGDFRDDLVIGRPGDNSVNVYIGPDFFTRQGAYLSQGIEGLPGVTRAGDAFGRSLAAGDVNGDGLDDLAIGAPGDDEDKGWSTGSVTVVYGDRDAILTGTGSQRFSKDTPGVPGAPGKYEPRTGDGADEFGLKLAMGDFNGDGRADLAASAPGTHVSSGGKDRSDAGSVTILYSVLGRVSATGSIQITQDTPGIVGAPGDNDFFGDTITAGDSNRDGIADLAVFSYGDEYLSVIPGTPNGLAATKAAVWSQNSPDIPGSQESGDKWGASMRFLGGGRPALLVGAPGEDNRQGAFTVVHIGATGLTGTGAKYFCENSAGVPGTSENGDRFGTF